MIMLYKAGERIPATIKQNDPPTVEEAAAWIGGKAFVGRQTVGVETFLFDEDGMLRNLKYNPAASERAGFPLVGNVIVLTAEHRKGWR